MTLEWNPDVDELIRPLVDALNRAGYHTSDSCQGSGTGTYFHRAYIAFHDVDVHEDDLPNIRRIVKSYTASPFSIEHAYYENLAGKGKDPDAGMYSIIFKGAYTPRGT